jgi:hypothetical protein
MYVGRRDGLSNINEISMVYELEEDDGLHIQNGQLYSTRLFLQLSDSNTSRFSRQMNKSSQNWYRHYFN